MKIKISTSTIKMVTALLAFIQLVNGYRQVSREKRMTGGKEINIKEGPFVVYIKNNNSFCSGVIVSRWNVITAGHCGLPYISHLAYVRAGSESRCKHGKKHLVKSFVAHPNLTVDAKHLSATNDIGVIRVEEPFEYVVDKIQPIALHTSGNKLSNVEARVYGWGRKGSKIDAVHLRRLVVDIVGGTNKCNQIIEDLGLDDNTAVLSKDQDCVLTRTPYEYPCWGDSGGPVTVNNQLVGVTSWGGYCDFHHPFSPTIITEVSHHKDWIDKYVQYDDKPGFNL